METATERRLSWPAPLAPPGTLQGFWTVARASARQLFFSRRTLLVGLLAALPVLLAAVLLFARQWLSLPQLRSASGFYQLLFTFVYTHVLLLLVPLLYGTGLISDEVEAKTLTCLLTRPVSKTVVLLAKLAAYAVVALAVVAPSLLACFAMLQLGETDPAHALSWLIQDLGVLAAGLLIYGAIFAFFGLALKRSLLIGLLFGIWESVFAYVPGFFHKLTVLHYLQANSRIASEYAAFLAIVRESTPADQARLTLLIVFVVVVAAGIAVFHRREYRQQGTETA